MKAIKVTGSSVAYVTDAKGNKVTTGTVGTGYTFRTDEQKFNLLIRGDVDGDGSISAIDLLYVKRHMLNVKKLTGVYLQAANVNSDSNVDAIDLLYIKRHILKIYTISQ